MHEKEDPAVASGLAAAPSFCGIEPARQAIPVSVRRSRGVSVPPSSTFAYPATQRIEHFDTYHGTRVADPYRWLETPDSETKQWIQAQNAPAQPYLETIPARERIKKRMTQLWNYESATIFR